MPVVTAMMSWSSGFVHGCSHPVPFLLCPRCLALRILVLPPARHDQYIIALIAFTSILLHPSVCVVLARFFIGLNICIRLLASVDGLSIDNIVGVARAGLGTDSDELGVGVRFL